MSGRPSLLGLAASLLCASLGLVSSALAAPQWLYDAAHQSNPPQVGSAPVTLLLDETRLVFDDDGLCTEEHRMALRINSLAGEDYASAGVYYLDRNDRVTASTAWLLRREKVVESVRAGNWIDLAAASAGSVFDEYRFLTSGLNEKAQIGDVFGYETRVVGHRLFAQFIHRFQTFAPSVMERFVCEVPAGWPVTVGSLNGARLIASVSPDRRVWHWELPNWPYVESEPHSVTSTHTAPTVYGSFVPPPSVARSLPTFRSWADAADWQIKLAAGQCDRNPALAAQARTLTAGCPDQLSRIRALCRFVQDSIAYVAINRDLGLGFGYRPRKATEIAGKAYGDCKDKVNLLASLLDEIGVRSHMLVVLAEEGAVIVPDWPSPTQFNHAIIGIEVDDSIQLSTVIPHTPCGRLLIFDPTDHNTPLGSLPLILQGNQAALMIPDAGQLVEIPILPAAEDRLITRTVHLRVAPDASATGTYSLVAQGQMGAFERRWIRTSTPQVMRETVAERLAGFLPAVQLTSVTAHDDPDRNTCGFDSEFSLAALGQRVAGGFAVVHLDVPSRSSRPLFPAATRETPIQLEALELRDEFVLDLPPNCSVEEQPTDAVIDTLVEWAVATVCPTEPVICWR